MVFSQPHLLLRCSKKIYSIKVCEHLPHIQCHEPNQMILLRFASLNFFLFCPLCLFKPNHAKPSRSSSLYIPSHPHTCLFNRKCTASSCKPHSSMADSILLGRDHWHANRILGGSFFQTCAIMIKREEGLRLSYRRCLATTPTRRQNQ